MRRFIIIAILILTNFCLAQSLKLPDNIQTPTAASLGKYGDVPVSLYNGAINVGIPLYTIKEQGMNMDISLAYDGSGVRVDSAPGWVGQNWSLNAGGVITRTINGGYPDEFKIVSNPSTWGVDRYGFMDPIARGRLTAANWSDTYPLYNLVMSNMGLGTNQISADGKGKDSEPDIFTFNFMGHTGRFFMGEDGIWKVASDENFKVTIREQDFIYPLGISTPPAGADYLSLSIGKISLTDDQGNVYTFGGTSNGTTAIEYSMDFFNQSNITAGPDSWKANAWYLTEIRNSVGTILYTLNYEREAGYTGSFYNYQNGTSTNIVLDQGQFGTNSCNGFTGSGLSGPGSPAVGGNIISPVYLTKITPLSQESIYFFSSPCTSTFYQSLNNYDTVSSYISNLWQYYYASDQTGMFPYLAPYNSAQQVVSKLKYRALNQVIGTGIGAIFNYNQPTSPGVPHDQRLNLNSVVVNGKTYQFEYDRFEQVPRLLSKAVDHLGYYRGTPYPNPTVSPETPSNHFNHRTTDADKVLVGTLKKIIYPTKGFSFFEYEPQQYSQYVSDDKQSLITVSNSIIGGVRIAKVTSDDLHNSPVIKTYKYVKNYNANHNSTISSGILSSLPKYYWPDWRTHSAPDSDPGYMTENHFSINPLISMSNFFGAPVGYSEVVEINNDQSYTIYKYSSNENYRDEPYVTTFNFNPSPYQKFNDKSMLRGKLLETTMYNNNDAIVNKSTRVYATNDPDLIKYVKGADLRTKTCIPTESPGPGGFAHGFIMGNAYKIYYFDNDVISQKNISFLNGQQIKTETFYTYRDYPDLASSFGDRFLKTKTTETYLDLGQYDSENLQESYDYTFDISSSINTSMVSNRRFDLLQKTTKRNGITIFTDALEYGSFPPFIRPSRTMYSKGNSTLEDKQVINSYDMNGNVTEFHEKDGLYTSFAWSYGNKYPIAMLIGDAIAGADRSFLDAKAADIQALIGNTGSCPPQSPCIQPVLDKLTEIRNHFPNHQVTTYTYYPGVGVTTVTDPKGDLQTYTYDSYGRLINVKDKDGNILSENQYHYKP